MTTNYIEFLLDHQFSILSELLYSIGGKWTSMVLSAGVEEGENFAGIIIDARIMWENNATASYFIVKVIPRSTKLLSLIPIEAFYEREIYLYSEIFPEFRILQRERNVLKPFKSYPIFYKPLTSTSEMLVFENLKKLGLRHANKQRPLDYNHIVIVIKEYARLHALSLATRDQKPKLFEKFVKNTYDHFYKNFEQEGTALYTKHRIENALKSLDSINDKSVFDKFSYYCNNLFPVMTKLINEPNQYWVISHVDTGIPNLLFNYENQLSIPTDVSIIDWQHSRLASPAVDLATFLFSASDKSLRSRYDNLILEYYQTLSLFLSELGSDVEKLLPFQCLQSELKRYSIVGLFMAIMLMYIYTTPQKVPNVFDDDSHKEKFSFIYELEDRSEFDNRVRDAIIDFDRIGYNFW